MDLEEFEGVPDNIKSLVESIGVIGTDALEPDVRDMVERFVHGDCMTCGTKLGSNTVVIINKVGITAMYCGGACLSDMGVMGWLEEQYQDVMDNVQFRGGKGDTTDEGV